MKISPADRQKLLPLLQQLCTAVEDLLLTGLTTVSESTRQTLNVTFQETSRMGLLRLGSTLRFANEELGRFTRNEAEFSRKRFSFFLNRAWILSHGLMRAIKAGNDSEFERLSIVPPSAPVAQVKVVTMGMLKKLASGVVSFEFRLRLLEPVTAGTETLQAGQKLVWSCLFPVKPGLELPVDAFMHLSQKQKFAAVDFLAGNVMTITDAAVSIDRPGVPARISLTEKSTVSSGEKFSEWQQFLTWDRKAAAERIRNHKVSPLDLEVEMQEEIVLDQWAITESHELDEAQLSYTVYNPPAVFNALVSRGKDGLELTAFLNKTMEEKTSPTMFSLLHYEKCKLVLQPLTVFTEDGPQYLMRNPEKIDKQKMVKLLSFT